MRAALDATSSADPARPAEGDRPRRGRSRPWFHAGSVPDVPDETPRAIPRSLPRTRERGEVDEIVAKSKAAIAKRPARQIAIDRPRDTKADELDLVLEKISRTGLDSLTSDERMLLEEMSKRLRDR